ncbi:MAG TPA: Crp/Fnr family transcriptional regulator [Chitinophagaceae bacterium]|nr:Crp/Fnr family transcriptional regulator [Chitinophagaceae bacterium]
MNFELDCKQCTNHNKSIFCNAKDLDFLNKSKISSDYRKGQTIFNEGTTPFGLYCINQGKVKISKPTDDGRELIIRLAKSGDLIGYKALLSGEKYTASAIALDDSSVCFIPKDAFLDILKKDHNLSLKLMSLISSELRKAETKVAQLAHKPVRERLAETLLLLKETFGLKEDEKTLNVELSREEIANIVGTATESIIRTLSEFRKDGIVELNGKNITIVNKNLLITRANLQE